MHQAAIGRSFKVFFVFFFPTGVVVTHLLLYELPLLEKRKNCIIWLSIKGHTVASNKQCGSYKTKGVGVVQMKHLSGVL